mmetsp:Transcript_15925/g.44486  ORF Transcript_15925/g.44486 Transcript_15925/m.44486 type:complete len:497 (+) Transcript_15925:156-1646(+)
MREAVEQARQSLGKVLSDSWDGLVRAGRQLSSQESGSSSTKFVCMSIPELARAPKPSRSPRRRPFAFASVSMSGAGTAAVDGGNEDDEDRPGYLNIGPTLAIGKRGRKRGVPLTDEQEINDLKEYLKTLDAEELASLEALAHKKILNSIKTDKGKPLYDEAMAVFKKIKEDEMGIGQPTMRQLPRWEQDLLIRPEKLRPGAEKMQLRPWEEEELELELMGNGNIFSPVPVFGKLFGGRREFAYGVYARSKLVPEILEEWRNRDQTEVITDPGFYRDMIVSAPALQLTVMLIPSRDLPVAEAVDKLRPRMEAALSQLEPTDNDNRALDRFLNMFHQPHLKIAPFLKPGPVLQQGSRLIFTCGKNGQIVTEGINAGKIKDMMMTPVHWSPNNKVTYSFFDSFIGDNALDPVAKQSVGKGMSYIANGFSFQLSENTNQVLVRDPNAPPETQLKVESWRNIEEELVPSLSLFRFLPSKDQTAASKTPLLCGIQQKLQGHS